MLNSKHRNIAEIIMWVTLAVVLIFVQLEYKKTAETMLIFWLVLVYYLAIDSLATFFHFHPRHRDKLLMETPGVKKISDLFFNIGISTGMKAMAEAMQKGEFILDVSDIFEKEWKNLFDDVKRLQDAEKKGFEHKNPFEDDDVDISRFKTK